MAQRLLLAVFFVLITVQLISFAEGETCRSRCNLRCRLQKKRHGLQVSLMSCLKRCQGLPKNCQRCNQANKKCSKCLPGFQLTSNFRCIPKCPAGCNCDSTGACVSCQSGYVATVPSTGPPCAACPANCYDCSGIGPTGCVTCNGGFTLINGVCQACKSGCLNCDSGIATCEECKTGYHKVSGTPVTCAACPANCAKCDIFTTAYCDACIEGYGLNSDHTKCVACAPNCKTCNWNGYNSCDSPQCVSGYGYDSMGTCTIACSAGCETCSSETACLKCMAGYTLSGGACTSTSTGCTSNMPNCASCTSDPAKCAQCASGYGVVAADGSCKKCVTPNCLTCTFAATTDTTDVTCTKCADGYIAQTGGTVACLECMVGCKDCTSANVDTVTGYCKTCYNGVTPTDTGTCLSYSAGAATCSAGCAPPYCAVSGDGMCDVNCIPGYVLIDNVCTPCTAAKHCKHCTAGINTCDGPQCKNGYSLTADNKCKAN